MFKVMTVGLVHSKHETEVDAIAEIARVREQTRGYIQRLQDDITETEEYAAGLAISEV